MYSTLPDKLSKTMAKNLSVPIAFVCLLHLCNEKVSEGLRLGLGLGLELEVRLQSGLEFDCCQESQCSYRLRLSAAFM